MRITSELWVKSFLRQAMASGVFGAVVRHGDDTSGAIFIRVNRQDGTSRVFGPAYAGFDAAEGERVFMPLLDGRTVADAEVDELLEREARFDRDLWIVEIERPDGDPMLGECLQSLP